MQRVMEPQNLDGAIRRNQLKWDKKSEAHFDEEIKQMFDSYSLTYLWRFLQEISRTCV
jgi:hypothetical protein